MALPFIDNLSAALPHSSIDVWCGSHTRPVFEIHPAIESIVEIPSVPRITDLPLLLWKLTRSQNDGFYLLDRSRLIDSAINVGATVLGTVRSSATSIEHETDRYLDVLVRAGIPVSIREPAISLSTMRSPEVDNAISASGSQFVVLHPGGAENPGTSMQTKRWPVEHWQALITWLTCQSIGIVLTGSDRDRALCAKVARGSTAQNLAGTLSLMESAAVGGASDAFVGPDTGLTHLVASTGASTIAIFGPTNPRQYAPRGRNVTILAASESYEVKEEDLRVRHSPGSPSTSEVSVDEVIDALERTLSRCDPSR